MAFLPQFVDSAASLPVWARLAILGECAVSGVVAAIPSLLISGDLFIVGYFDAA